MSMPGRSRAVQRCTRQPAWSGRNRCQLAAGLRRVEFPVLRALPRLDHAVDGGLHAAADLELHDLLRRDADLLERARVLRLASRALLHLENTELAELEPVATGQLLHDLVQEEL